MVVKRFHAVPVVVLRTKGWAVCELFPVRRERRALFLGIQRGEELAVDSKETAVVVFEPSETVRGEIRHQVDLILGSRVVTGARDAAAQNSLPVRIVPRAFVRVAQGFVRASDFFEFRISFG